MIKNIAYFPLQAARNSPPVLDAFTSGVRRRGIAVVENSWTADAAVIWSVLWHGRMRANLDVYNHYRSQNKPVLIIEVGALYRGTTWKIAVNNITANGYYGHDINLDLDRPRKLGISLADLSGAEPHIIVTAQHHASLQVADITSMEDWVLEKVQQLRSITDRPIVVRPHPRSSLQLANLPKDVTIQAPKPVAGTYDDFDMHYNCHAVVNHNSGPGIQAAIGGVRPIVDDSSLACPVSVSMLNLEKPYVLDREQWLIEICHTEYTLEEMRQGCFIDRLCAAL